MDKKGSRSRQKTEALRREYIGEELSEANAKPDPVDQFAVWFQQALASDLLDPNAVALATAAGNGIPSVRIVLLKGVDRDGFRFYTNYRSRKGRELAENPKAALCFYWAVLDRQVRVEGQVVKLNRKESEQYFQQRPRISQLSAWASPQSEKITSREHLIEEFRELEHRFGDKQIPVPEFWGGYLLQPDRVEFWQGRPGRLHDRLLYTKAATGWEITRLAP